MANFSKNKPYIYKNYSTQKEYIKNRLAEIEKISDRGERFGQFYALEIELQKTKRQYGGNYMGVGKACLEGIQILLSLQE